MENNKSEFRRTGVMHEDVARQYNIDAEVTEALLNVAAIREPHLRKASR